MIKVLVVDDDKLVRRGLISSMPWADFGMEVTGEANSGAKALELLAEQPFDLMLTDLAMPVMSGIELMRIARERYPELPIVVLTMHQDFEYIQEALRLGAIDYIAKIQLEKERFDEVLGRVHGRILQERRKERTPAAAGDNERCEADAVYALLSHEKRPHADWLQRQPELRPALAEIGLNAWLWTPAAGQDGCPEQRALAAISGHDGWRAMKVTGVRGMKLSAIHHALRHYMAHEFFYDCEPAGSLIVRSPEQLQPEPPELDEAALAAMKERWLSFEWLRSDEELERLLDELRTSRLPLPQLIRLLAALDEEWRRTYVDITEDRLELPASIDCWTEAEDWLRALAGAAVDTARGASYSREITAGVMAAVRIVRQELDRQLYAVDVARRVGISRGYFSQCFKDVTGRSFNDFLRHARMEKAKEYLLQTRQPIQWIAERTGYMDEKYFSRVFRDLVGSLPSEYRQSRLRETDKP